MRDLSRSAILDRLRQADPPEVLVVGAGINGAAVFWDLALQGVRAVLVDMDDIGSGASAAPSRMIHGGLRYLETAEIKLVRQSTYERNLLLRNARHLVAPLRTVVPLYSRWGGTFAAIRKLARLPSGPGRRGSVLVRIGLTLYDLLGRRARLLPAHRMLRREAALAAMPGLTQGITAAAEYYDAWITHPERLNLELVLDALHAAPSCEALTHAAVVGISEGQVLVRDRIGGETLRLAPRIVINAAGAWIDRVNALFGVRGRLIGGTKGSHLVIDHPGLQAALGDAMLWFEAEDGRTCIVFPFLGYVLLGSTDIRVDDPDSVRCDESEVDYLFAVLREVFPDIALGREHIVFRYAGVRPLPHVDAASTALIPRSHSLPVSEPEPGRPFPVFSMVGGKWTTFRGFAEEAADEVLRRLGRGRRVDTSGCGIGGGKDFPATPASRMAWIRQVAAEARLPEGRVATLLDRYGTRARALALAAGSDADLPLRALPDYSRAEIAWILREELVAHLADLVLRRTLIAIRGQASDAALRELAGIAAETLGWSAERREAELAATVERLRILHGVALREPEPLRETAQAA
jgi:glycerol-3-phosphate dehydrogenase